MSFEEIASIFKRPLININYHLHYNKHAFEVPPITQIHHSVSVWLFNQSKQWQGLSIKERLDRLNQHFKAAITAQQLRQWYGSQGFNQVISLL